MGYWFDMRRELQIWVAAACVLMAGCGRAASTAPDLFHVNLETSKGDIVIEVHRDWAPIGADRFYTLVKRGFFDGARFFRVLPGFVAQFGIAADPKVTAQWKDKNLPDDPVKQSNVVGTVAYAAEANPNTRSTQLFLNLGDNQRLDARGFAPIGKIISGMEVAQSFYSGYGEGAPRGSGPDQELIEKEGNAYLQSQFPMLDYIKKASAQ